MGEFEGCFNKSADAVKREDMVWSDTNLENDFSERIDFKRLKCRNCKGLDFEVLQTSDYETSAKCVQCKMYYIVHSG